MSKSDIWTGLACLKANPNVKNFRRFGKGRGAWVNVVAWADSQETFEENIRTRAADLDCILMELDEVKLLEVRLSDGDCPEQLITMRATAIRQPKDTMFGTFHIWHQNESN